MQVGRWDSFQAIKPYLNAPTPSVVDDAFESATERVRRRLVVKLSFQLRWLMGIELGEAYGLKYQPNRLVSGNTRARGTVGILMVGSPLIANPGKHDYDILHMPGYRQAQNAPECIHYALWIAIHYVANEYPDSDVRDRIQPPKLDLISEYIDVGELGWEDVGQEPLTQLASETGGLKLHLQYKYNGLPQPVDEFASERFDQLLPTIIWIDQVLLKNNERGEGPMHAVVVCGVSEEHITIEDPLVEGTTTLEIDRIDDAWDPEFNTAIELKLRDGLEPTRREEL